MCTSARGSEGVLELHAGTRPSVVLQQAAKNSWRITIQGLGRHHVSLTVLKLCYFFLECRVAELQAALEAANAEKAAAKQQLSRLKQQMLVEQDDEEEKIR